MRLRLYSLFIKVGTVIFQNNFIYVCIFSKSVDLESRTCHTGESQKKREANRQRPTSHESPCTLARKRGRALPTAWSRKYKLKDTSDYSDLYESYDDEAAEIFLSTSANLAYSWDTLGLGQDLGSAALNRYMARFNENSPQLTAQQTLQIVNSLRLQTIMPPEFSALHRIIQRVS